MSETKQLYGTWQTNAKGRDSLKEGLDAAGYMESPRREFFPFRNVIYGDGVEVKYSPIGGKVQVEIYAEDSRSASNAKGLVEKLISS